MNKTKISGKIKSLALLCLYTTIRIGEASIVSSCGSENASAENDELKPNPEREALKGRGAGINDFEKIKADLEKREIDAIKAKNEAINDKKTVETENTKLKKEKTILSERAIIQDVWDTWHKLSEEIHIVIIESVKYQTDGNISILNQLKFAKIEIFFNIVNEINALLINKEEKPLTNEKIFNQIYYAFFKKIQLDFLNKSKYNKHRTYDDSYDKTYDDSSSSCFALFRYNNVKNIPKEDIMQCKVTTSANQEIMAPVLICSNDMKEINADGKDKNSLIVIPTNSTKEMLRGLCIKILKGIRTGCE